MISAKDARADVSSMSQMLLQGWAMLDLSCISCKVPLLRKRGQDTTYCVHCKETFGKVGKPQGQEASSPAAAPKAVEQPPPAYIAAPLSHGVDQDLQEFRQMRSQMAPTSAASAAASMEDPAQALAEKMLQGWALLGVHCPRCSHPLVRNKERKMWCVVCCLWVLSEEEGAAAAARAKASTGGLGSDAAPPPAEEGLKLEPKGPAGVLHTDQAVKKAPLVAAAITSKHSSIDQAVLSLQDKMAEAAEALSHTPASHTGVSACLQYVQLIRECCSALGDLSNLQAKHPRLS
mmetsp:Transcript_14946/g.41986  ORF Transcript_14946/g.41986 Transcript_14946/m.41986 type:complete len:290 (-) Transcript_14946:67-936(-)|eukprot:CAMPEP_0117682208 /NCGR_PEP_ID=MMETSP0804-20121206/19493_1 /TAXON_ID=1074897 /ORGANISM="Tetraselmis astigmatica, Strain CCMP880" /LENGTH=289 /DNA_ID=CAMNT_0005492217 /DNA_START=93 /DNA_END=962 /DNA_ORIENTATION=-